MASNAQILPNGTYLVEVDNRLPEVVLLLVEISHTDFTELFSDGQYGIIYDRGSGHSHVTRMVLVDVGSVMVLTTSKTSTTGMLSVLTDTTVTCAHVSSAK
jgi:hypothetical protein